MRKSTIITMAQTSVKCNRADKAGGETFWLPPRTGNAFPSGLSPTMDFSAPENRAGFFRD